MSEQSQDCSLCPHESKIVGSLRVQEQGNTREHWARMTNK